MIKQGTFRHAKYITLHVVTRKHFFWSFSNASSLRAVDHEHVWVLTVWVLLQWTLVSRGLRFLRQREFNEAMSVQRIQLLSSFSKIQFKSFHWINVIPRSKDTYSKEKSWRHSRVEDKKRVFGDGNFDFQTNIGYVFELFTRSNPWSWSELNLPEGKIRQPVPVQFRDSH